MTNFFFSGKIICELKDKQRRLSIGQKVLLTLVNAIFLIKGDKPLYSQNYKASVLIVSASPKVVEYLRALLPPDEFSPVTAVGNAGIARRLFVDRMFDIVIINTPLPDEFGTRLALDISDIGKNSGVLMFVKPEEYDQVSYKMQFGGVITIAKPSNRETIYQSIKMLVVTNLKMRGIGYREPTLNEKMGDIRTVNKAKLLLIEKLGMSEPEAHRYIEKRAMDKGMKIISVAERIIKRAESGSVMISLLED